MSGVVGGVAGSFGARFYNVGTDSPPIPFSTSVTMEPSSFLNSSFHLPASVSRRSYAAAVQNRTPSDYPMNALSSSFNSLSMHHMSASLSTSYSRGQVHSLMAARSDAELTKEYECCKQKFGGLHELLEHVEDVHPLGEADMQGHNLFSMDMDMEGIDYKLSPLEKQISAAGSSRNSGSPPTYPIPIAGSGSKPATPSSELPPSIPGEITAILTSPIEPVHVPSAPLSRVSTNSSPPDGSVVTPDTSAQTSPIFPIHKGSGRSAFFPASKQAINQKRHFDRAFNDVVSGKTAEIAKEGDEKLPSAVAPTVLHGSAPPTPASATEAPTADGNEASAATAEKKAAADEPLPQPSLFSTDRPWRCPNPGCNKSYKQSNGLKYHREKGQCDFAIHDAVDLGLSLEEAERRNKPFVCAVGNGCNKRYRQMNGLKYHYLNSGEHGLWGLRMLENGTHPTPPTVPPNPTKPRPPQALHARPAAAPYTIPTNRPVAPGMTPARPGALSQTRPAGVTALAQAQQAAMKRPGAFGGLQPPIQRGPEAMLFASTGTLEELGRS